MITYEMLEKLIVRCNHTTFEEFKSHLFLEHDREYVYNKWIRFNLDGLDTFWNYADQINRQRFVRWMNED